MILYIYICIYTYREREREREWSKEAVGLFPPGLATPCAQHVRAWAYAQTRILRKRRCVALAQTTGG